MAMPLENIAALQQRLQAPCLGIIPWQAGASSDLVTSHQPDFRRVASLLNLSTLTD